MKKQRLHIWKMLTGTDMHQHLLEQSSLSHPRVLFCNTSLNYQITKYSRIPFFIFQVPHRHASPSALTAQTGREGKHKLADLNVLQRLFSATKNCIALRCKTPHSLTAHLLSHPAGDWEIAVPHSSKQLAARYHVTWHQLGTR